MWVWEPPNYNQKIILYVRMLVVEIADYSAFHIIDIRNLEQVAEYKGRINTKDFGNMLVSIATEYNDAILISREQ